MGGKILAALLLTVGIYLALQHCATAAPSTSEVSAAGTSVQRARVHSFPRVRARLVPLEPSSDLLSDFIIDDEFADFNKRQSTDGKREKEFDDYGHMRFGKREQFDDYGHMRFGRSLD